MIRVLHIGGTWYAYVPPQRLREPFPCGRFYRAFPSEQAAVDFVYGEWPDA